MAKLSFKMAALLPLRSALPEGALDQISQFYLLLNQLGEAP